MMMSLEMMVKRCVVTLAVVVTATASAAVMARAAGPALRTVHDAKNQLALSVPATWTVQAPAGDITLKATAPVPTGGLSDSVEVVVHSAPSGMSAQSCVNEAEWLAQHFGHITFTTLRTGPTSVAGLPAYSHVYTWNASTGQSRWSDQVCIVQQGQVYVVTATTANSPATLPAHSAVLTQIINSVRIQPQEQPASRTQPSRGSPPGR